MKEIKLIKNKFKKSIKIPGSKSISNRALICGALASGNSTLYNILDSDDTRVMVDSLQKLGYKISKQNGALKIAGGIEKVKNFEQKIYTKNAGTATRFLLAFLCLLNGDFTLSVNKRMSQRPINDLCLSLKPLKCNIKFLKKVGYPPLQILPSKMEGGKTKIKGNISSQYLSALLLTTPYAKKNTEITVTTKLTSKPYIKTTLEVIKAFKCQIQASKDLKKFKIKGSQKFKPQKYTIEADASSATYFLALAALHNSEITIKNLTLNSIQGDIAFLSVLEKMGSKIVSKAPIKIKGPNILKPLGKIDLNEIPDAAMTAVILAALAKGKSHITGLGNLRVKECDRLKALATELKKVGADVKELKSGIIINGDPEKLHSAAINTYDDHRMAMCFAVLGTKIPGIKIKNPDCVNKTYPNFWKDLSSIYKN